MHCSHGHLSRRAYFAYGLNMHLQYMAERCPGAVFQGVAQLNRHRFMINRLGVATIIRAEGSSVHGVLWTLTVRDERMLDAFEGVDQGYYRRRTTRVEIGNQRRPAFLYVATESALGVLRVGYLEIVMDAARMHRLPALYLAKLGKWTAR